MKKNEIIVCNTLESFLNDLSYIIDPDIVKNSVCTLDCCLGNNLPGIFECLLCQLPHFSEKIIGVSGMALLFQFAEAFDVAIYFDEGPENPEWVQEPGWIEFVELSTKLKRHIEYKLRQYEQGVRLRHKYSIEYLVDFVNDRVNHIAQCESLLTYHFDFFVRCECILSNPDNYEGMTWPLFNLINLLYSFAQAAYAGKIDAGYRGRWHRDETAGWEYVNDLRKNVFRLDDRIVKCAQLIVDEFKNISSKNFG